jgi:hypothetical protein
MPINSAVRLAKTVRKVRYRKIRKTLKYGNSF